MASAVEEDVIDRYQIAAELFKDMPEGFPYENYELEDITVPEGDDMGIPDVNDAGDEEDVETETGFGSLIVVSNLPVVPAEKFEKLCAVVRKIYSQIGNIREGGLYMPLDKETNLSKGFAFVEFTSPQEAQTAREQTNGYKLDKAHTFAVNMFDDFDKFAKVPDSYVAPEPKPYTPAENLHSWMMDKMGRDQFCVRNADDTAVFWNDGKRNRTEMVHQRQNWTESFVQWSPQGNYLTTMHRQGVAVWGGASFVRLMRYAHPSVRLVEFSPNEKYLITYTSHEPTNSRDPVTIMLMVFDVRSGRKLRQFEGTAEEFSAGSIAGSGQPLKWPVFKWAGGKEDSYFARLGKNTISVYQCPDMGLLDKKSLKVDAVQDFEWCPSEPIIAAYTLEVGNQPARIALIKIPERIELRQKNLFSVSDIKMFWHPQGEYLAVKVDRFTKTKKSTYTGFELFSVREKDIPMEVFELPNKNDKIHHFAWEPHGHRFAVVHGEGPRPNISFYSMKDDKGRGGTKLLSTLPGKACNCIFWSPMGHNIVLAGLKNLNGQLEFFNVDELETLSTAEHFMATDVEWDPTGRYVATSVSASHQMENGYNLWSFNGKLLYTQAKDRLYQFNWRPRLPSLLPPEREAEITKNLKAYSKRYEEEDEAMLTQADNDVLSERQKWQDEWVAYQKSRTEFVAILDGFKEKMLGPRYAEGKFSLQTATVEQIIEVKEEPYSTK